MQGRKERRACVRSLDRRRLVWGWHSRPTVSQWTPSSGSPLDPLSEDGPSSHPVDWRDPLENNRSHPTDHGYHPYPLVLQDHMTQSGTDVSKTDVPQNWDARLILTSDTIQWSLRLIMVQKVQGRDLLKKSEKEPWRDRMRGVTLDSYNFYKP